MEVANSSKCFPLLSSSLSVFQGCIFRQLFFQLLTLVKPLDSWDMALFTFGVKMTQSWVLSAFCHLFNPCCFIIYPSGFIQMKNRIEMTDPGRTPQKMVLVVEELVSVITL